MIPDIKILVTVLRLLEAIIEETSSNCPNVTLDFDLPSILPIVVIINNLEEIIRISFTNRRQHNNRKIHELIPLLRGYRKTQFNQDVWTNLSKNWKDFYWLTGEIPNTLQVLSNILEKQVIRNRGRKPLVAFRNKVLLTFIWLRRYPSMDHLGMHFGISVGYVCKILHKMLTLLHIYLVPRYIRWPSLQEWRNLAGKNPEWPRVVGLLDCTPFRISKPFGFLEQTYYRRDRHCTFENWIVITNISGDIVYSRPGFPGHLHDSTCFRHIQLPPFPPGFQIMADQGFVNQSPLLIPMARGAPQMTARMRRSFRRCRSAIERVFGRMKTSYCIAGTRRYRGRRYIVPLICNVTAALYNRRRIIFKQIL